MERLSYWNVIIFLYEYLVFLWNCNQISLIKQKLPNICILHEEWETKTKIDSSLLWKIILVFQDLISIFIQLCSKCLRTFASQFVWFSFYYLFAWNQIIPVIFSIAMEAVNWVLKMWKIAHFKQICLKICAFTHYIYVYTL